MGLGLKRHILAFVAQHVCLLSCLLCVGCVGMTALLPVAFSRGTYFSETSLGIGGAASAFGQSDTGWMQHQQERLGTLRESGRLQPHVIASLNASGAHPVVHTHDGVSVVSGRLAAHRATGTSGFLLAVSSSDAAALAFLLRAVSVWSSAVYLGMDLHVAVVTGSLEEGLRHYAHHLRGSTSGFSASSIKAGVVLDLRVTGFGFDSLLIRTLSSNALQPNMDFANSAFSLCGMHHVVCSMLTDVPPPPAWLRQASSQLVHLPNTRVNGNPERLAGNVMHFWKYVSDALAGDGAAHTPLRDAGVHVVTLEGVGTSGHRRASAAELSHIVSGLLRGMNNMCERLHQSFWIYIYTNNEHFVDYDTAQQPCWMGVGAVIASSLAFRADTRRVRPAAFIAGLLGTVGVGCACYLLEAVEYAGVVMVFPFVSKAMGMAQDTALCVKAVVFLYAVCFLSCSTVVSCPVALVGTVFVAVLACITPPCRGALGYLLGLASFSAGCALCGVLHVAEYTASNHALLFSCTVALPCAAAGAAVCFASTPHTNTGPSSLHLTDAQRAKLQELEQRSSELRETGKLY